MHFFSCITSFIFPPMGLPLAIAGESIDKRHYRWYAVCIALFAASFAYSFIPNDNSDLARYFQYIDQLKTLGFIDALNNDIYGLKNQGLVIFSSTCWFAAKLNDNHIVPALSVAIIYYIAARVSFSMGKITDKRIIGIYCIVIIMMMLNFYSLVNNVRNVLSFSLVTYAAFREFILGKKTIPTYILYILPIFIHPTAIILFAVRIIKDIAKRTKILLCCVAILTKPIVGFLYAVTQEKKSSGVLGKISFVIEKAYNYFYDKYSDWGREVANSGSEQLLKLLYIVVVIIIAVTIIIAMERINKKGTTCLALPKQTNDFLLFILALCVFSLACIPMFRPEYWRFANTAIVFLGAWGAVVSKTIKPKIVQLLLLGMSGIGACLFVLWVRNIVLYSQCSIDSLLIEPWKAGPITVLIKDIILL